jgi:putative phosphoribosyl transferase
MRFASRQDAGRQLGKFLRERGVSADLVLGLPRGGVVVAAEVARELKLPLDVLVVRKIGHPFQREFAVGALGEPEVISLEEELLRKFPVARIELNEVIEEEKIRLREYRRRFHLSEMPSLEGKNVLLVDDGLATGATAEVAAISARRQNAMKILIAAPVAASQTVERLRRVADDVVVLFEDFDFQSVGQYYEDFSQTGDEEVIELLRAAKSV